MIVLVRLTIGASTYRWSDAAFSDGTNVWDPRLSGQITYSRAGTLALWSSSRSPVNLGAIEVINLDGALDDLVTASVDGAIVETYLLTSVSGPVDSTTLVAKDDVDRIEAVAESAIRIVRRSVLDRLNAKAFAVGTFSGIDDAINGTPKPAALGRPFSCPIVLVDGVDYKYDVHDDATCDVTVVRDNGIVLSTPGGYNFLAPQVRLQATPVGQIVADVRADDSVPPGTHSVAECVAELLARAGLTSGEIDATAWSTAGARVTGGVSYWAGQGETCRVILDAIADSILAFVFTDNQGKVTAKLMQDPVGMTSVLTIDDSTIDGEIAIEPDFAPGLSTTVAAGRNWRPYEQSELADSVADADRIMLASEYRFRATVGPISDDIGSDPGGPPRGGRVRVASTVGYGTLLDSATAAGEIADVFAALYAPDTYARFVRATVLVDAATACRLNPGDCVTIDVDRYGLAATKAIIVEVGGEIGESRVNLKLWCKV